MFGFEDLNPEETVIAGEKRLLAKDLNINQKLTTLLFKMKINIPVILLEV